MLELRGGRDKGTAPGREEGLEGAAGPPPPTPGTALIRRYAETQAFSPPYPLWIQVPILPDNPGERDSRVVT